MPKGSTFQGDVLNLIFAAKAIANIADNAAASPLTALSVSAHSASPAGGDQTTNEVSYTGYTRVLTTRTTAGWVLTSGTSTVNAYVSPAATVSFPQATSTSTGTITHIGFGTSTSGAGKLLYSGTVTPNINYSQNVTPQITTSSSISES